jgi:hypothetical protein
MLWLKTVGRSAIAVCSASSSTPGSQGSTTSIDAPEKTRSGADAA